MLLVRLPKYARRSTRTGMPLLNWGIRDWHRGARRRSTEDGMGRHGL